MQQRYRVSFKRAAAIVLSVVFALCMVVPAFAGTRDEHVELQLGENALTLGTTLASSYYYFTPATSGDYIIRSVSSDPSDPYMEYNFTSYLDHDGSKDFYCVVSLTAGKSIEFIIRAIVDDSAVTVIVEEKEADLPNPLSLGDNALSLSKKNYAEEYSFTPEVSGFYRFSSDGYGQPGCVWGDEDIQGGIMIGEEWSWQFSFEKELTAGTGYVFKPYNQSGAYEGVVTITKLEAATVELDGLDLSFATAPSVLTPVGLAVVTLPADSHCTVEWTWTDQYGETLAVDALFLCGSYFLSAIVTADNGYAFASGADVTFDALDAAEDHEIAVSGGSAVINARFVFGNGAHSYAGWEEMSNIQVAGAGLGEPYAGCVWEQNVCGVCEYTKYRGGDTAEICRIELVFSDAPASDLTMDDINVAVAEDRPYYLVALDDGSDPAYPGWTGDFGDGIRFLCRESYTGLCLLFPTDGHYFTRDGDLDIQVEVTPADAVVATDYEFISSSEGVYVSTDFAETDHIYAEPVWSWADDYSEAYADFACVYGDWTVTATVHNPPQSVVSEATYTSDKTIKYTATALFRDATYTAETDPIPVAGTAQALLVADTAEFDYYKSQQIALLDELALDGDSAACVALIAQAKEDVSSPAFDTGKTLAQNKAAVDAVVASVTAQLNEDLAAQRAADALAAAKAEFDHYKAAKAAEPDALAQPGDSDASKALIANAKVSILALVYDESKSPAENMAAVDAHTADEIAGLTVALATQRAAETLAAAKAEFDQYKASKAAELDALARSGDSDASKALIANAKAAVLALAYDESKTPAENRAAADAGISSVTAQLNADLAAQRAADQPSGEDDPIDPDEPQQPGTPDEPGQQEETESFLARLLRRIREFFDKIVQFFRNLFAR